MLKVCNSDKKRTLLQSMVVVVVRRSAHSDYFVIGCTTPLSPTIGSTVSEDCRLSEPTLTFLRFK